MNWSWIRIKAEFSAWLHGWTHFTHQIMAGYGKGQVLFISCSCGKVFYTLTPPHGEEW